MSRPNSPRELRLVEPLLSVTTDTQQEAPTAGRSSELGLGEPLLCVTIDAQQEAPTACASSRSGAGVRSGSSSASGGPVQSIRRSFNNGHDLGRSGNDHTGLSDGGGRITDIADKMLRGIFLQLGGTRPLLSNSTQRRRGNSSVLSPQSDASLLELQVYVGEQAPRRRAGAAGLCGRRPTDPHRTPGLRLSHRRIRRPRLRSHRAGGRGRDQGAAGGRPRRNIRAQMLR